ncbi:MAG: 5'-methylthioadenosine/S-adenosylhomocysteine nucleosidase [Olsenella sp.]|nr:5'-methylthioadenosine/S-adenosylhomocysteine nucleosidase [Olsenella sp.]
MPGVDTLAFPANPELRAAAVAAVEEAAPDVRAFEGRVASGDQFVCGDAEKERITSTFGAICCEMEGASIAHVCHLNDVPFVIVRAISDKAAAARAWAIPPSRGRWPATARESSSASRIFSRDRRRPSPYRFRSRTAAASSNLLLSPENH